MCACVCVPVILNPFIHFYNVLIFCVLGHPPGYASILVFVGCHLSKDY